MTHFYLDQKPFYTIKDAKGKDRPTTLRDARKTGAVAGVTSIIGQLDKGFLNIWKQKRLLDIVLEEVEDVAGMAQNIPKWKEILIGLSEERNSSYSQEGNRVHDILELYFKEGRVEPQDEALVYPVVELLEGLYSPCDFEPEKSFSCSMGFGGCIDLLCHTPDGVILIDFKTKNKSNLSKVECTKEYMMQLAAYKKAMELEHNLNIIVCANLLISLESVGENYFHIWSDNDILKGEKMFLALLDFWKLSNNLPG